MVTLRQLRYFESVSRVRHFGRAAQECAVTQPALSQQIRDLEADLGTTLLERGKSHIALTNAGEDVARRAREILAAVNDLHDSARERGEVLSGPLKLGVIPSIGPYLLPEMLPQLREEYPKLQLHVRESQTHNLLDWLNDGRIDLALLALPVEASGIESLRLFQDRFYLVLPSAHKLSGAPQVGIQSLAGDRIMLLEEGHCLRDQAITLCSRIGLEGFEEFGATSLSTLVQLVANGFGITILPQMAVGIEAESRSGLKVVRFESPEPSRTVGLVWRETSPRKADFMAFGRLVAQVHEQLARGHRRAAPHASRASRLSR